MVASWVTSGRFGRAAGGLGWCTGAAMVLRRGRASRVPRVSRVPGGAPGPRPRTAGPGADELPTRSRPGGSERIELSTFVLVHGAWHGGWCWDRVTPHLRAAGHEVHTPTLTGLSERAHLLSPMVGLDTHIEDVVRLIDTLGLSDVILVGHSYGGMVITGAAARVPERIAHVVYLDAFLPRAGEAAWDLLPWQREAFQQLRLPDRPWLVRPVDAAAFFPELGEGFDDNRPHPDADRHPSYRLHDTAHRSLAPEPGSGLSHTFPGLDLSPTAC